MGCASATNRSQSFWEVLGEQPEEEDASALIELENELRRRLSGAHCLPRGQRAPAYREAKDWYWQALAVFASSGSLGETISAIG